MFALNALQEPPRRSKLTWVRTWEWFKDGIKAESFVVSGLGKRHINR